VIRPGHRALAGIAIFTLAVLGVAAAGWDPIQQLTSGSNDASLPSRGSSCAVQGDFVHLAYAGIIGATDVVLYMRSTDRGSTWQSPVFLDSATFGSRFGLYADGAGVLHFFNCRKYTSNVCYRRSTDNGESWTPAVVLANYYEQPAYVADNDSCVYMADNFATETSLRLWRTTNSGSNWEGPNVVTSGGTYVAICLACDDQSRVHLAWQQTVSEVRQLFHARSTDNGQSWGTPNQLSSGAANNALIGIYSDRGDNLVLVYSREGTDEDFRVSTDAGTSWGAAKMFPWAGYTIDDCVADQYGGFHAVHLVDGSRVMYFRGSARAAAWSDTVELTGFPPGSVRQNPKIIIDDAHNLHAFWVGRETGKKQVYYRRGSGVGGVEEPARPGAASGTVLCPNPARRSVRLLAAGPASVYDPSGKLVWVLLPGQNDITGLTPGVYLLKTQASAGQAILARLVRTR
jgi:hypothetical protein